MERIKSYLEKFRADLGKYPLLIKAETYTKVPKEYLVLGTGALMLVCLLLRIGANLICNLGGFVYPAFCSFKAIESEGTKDDTQWLTYWVVFAAFSILETFVEYLLYWIPFYYAFKLAFLVWCFLPQTRGAAFLYRELMRDVLSTPKTSIDGAAKIPMDGVGHMKGN
ncbi:unnamed protein product [Discosporangium mesarthrocarpum]